MKGALISFDGLDSSGKATQVSRLIARLRDANKEVVKIETPDYTTPSGKELKLRLQGKLGDWLNTPWQEKMEYFATNRAEHKEEVINALDRGAIVVYDRYIPSSLVFMIVEAGSATAREEVFAVVEHSEYKKNGMPREHISLFLDVPPAVAARLLSGRKEVRSDEDEYTDQLAVQEKMYQEYQRLSKEGRVVRIDCMDGERLRTPDEIEVIVWQAVSSRLVLASPDKGRIGGVNKATKPPVSPFSGGNI